ncbi:hypothetical protein MKW94_008097 [Papaver nudicaule]|uniref:Uncharacterized protein n=1 Tax=Papaver nudicaule TaxID=74823 RepID=A0AA41SIA5_PAPNU|nr:hypothetical protein [Papaver nudicaule]
MGRKNVARCVAELAEENGGNPPTEGDVFIKTHVNKDSKKAWDPTSQGFIDQMREQSGLDLNGLDEDGKQQPISDEVFVNVVPTCRKKRVRAERQNLTYSSSGRNEDYEREKKEREEEFSRLLSAQNAAWESRLKAQQDEYNRSHHQMLEYVRLVRPELFTIPRQLSGPSDHLFMNYRLGGQPHRNLEQPCGPLERPYRSEEQLFQPEEQAYRPGDQLNRSQNDCKHLFLDFNS